MGDLINNLFRHPYTKIEFVIEELSVSRPTASRFMQELVANSFLLERKIGRSKFFVNEPLFSILMNAEDAS